MLHLQTELVDSHPRTHEITFCEFRAFRAPDFFRVEGLPYKYVMDRRHPERLSDELFLDGAKAIFVACLLRNGARDW